MSAMKRPRHVTHTTLAKEGTAMRRKPRSIWSRVALAGLASGLVFLLAGDGPANTALIGGIDPLQIMDLEVKNNVLILFDTSGSMKFGTTSVPGFSRAAVGEDDVMGRMAQAKEAMQEVVDEFRDRLNLGILSFIVTNGNKPGWTTAAMPARIPGVILVTIA